MALLSAAGIAGVRAGLEILLVHTCTRQPMMAGAEDAHGNTPSVPNGAAVTNVPCTYGTVARIQRDESGVSTVNVPTLMVKATEPIAVGDQISAVADSLGQPPLGVPTGAVLRVERVLDDTAGLGAPLLPTWELRYADTVWAS